MKRWILAAALAASMLLCGCAALLGRSYSLVEPYADRYWDSGEEDTLKVDNYQDLVNSLVMLIEQRAEEAVIRCYDEVGTYQQVMKARNEVRWDTMKGSYLLQNIRFTFEEGTNYGTASFTMSYRENVEDLDGVMMLSDSQSLVDLLRLAIREEHDKITARFIYDTPRTAVSAVVESYWQELCQEEMEEDAQLVFSEDELLPEQEGEEDETGELGENPENPENLEAPEAPKDLESPEDPEASDPENGGPEGDGDAEAVSGGPEEEPEPIVYPPCPWVVRYYPNQELAELVEVQLQ